MSYQPIQFARSRAARKRRERLLDVCCIYLPLAAGVTVVGVYLPEIIHAVVSWLVSVQAAFAGGAA